MYQATLTRQGQITVPVEVREMLGLMPGDRLFFWKYKDKVVIDKNEGLESLRGVFAKSAIGKPKLTLKVLNKIRGEMYTERYRKYLKQNEDSHS